MANRPCQICGMSYKGKSESQKHDAYCRKHLKACAKFGTIYNPEECEAIRNDIKNILSDNEIPLSEKVDAAEKFFGSYFSQSVRDSGFDLKHCSFSDYRANMLSKEYFNDLLKDFPVVYSSLLRRWLWLH